MGRFVRSLACCLMLAIAAPAPGLQAFAQVQAQSSYQITVKTLTGVTYTFDVTAAMKVSDVKQMITDKSGVPIAEQNLIFAGVVLQDERTLSDYSIGKDSTLHMVLRQRGG